MPKIPVPQQRRGGCGRAFVLVWVAVVGLGIIGALAGDDEPVGDGGVPVTPTVVDAVGVSGETLQVGRYAVTVTASFAPTVPELGSSGYVIADVTVTGDSPLLPLAPFGFSLRTPDGNTLENPFRPRDGRLVWDIGTQRGAFEILWETPDIVDGAEASWRLLVE